MGPSLPSFVGWLYITFVGLTSRVRVKDHPAFSSLVRSGRPFIYAFWHRVQFFLAYPHRGERLAILVSRSRDGELIARTIERFGLSTIRGSSTRGGARAMGEMIRAIRSGLRVAITPDGPKGPAGQVQPGAILLALKAGVPVVPVSCAARRKIVFRSWDRYILPLPFNHIALVHGEPLLFLASEPPPARADRLRESLDAASRSAEEAL